MRGARTARIAAAYLRTRVEARRLDTRGALSVHQQALWRQLAPALAATPALAGLAGRALEEFPIVSPAQMRADVAAWNSVGLSAEDAHAAAEAAEGGGDQLLPGDFQAGYSTGSDGVRGLFITTQAERDDYIGILFGKLIGARRLLRPLRVALILRANNRLYQDVRGARAAFTFIAQDQAVDEQARALQAFGPTHLVAPPHVLAALAKEDGDGDWRAAVQGLFYGAEPVGPLERQWLGDVYGRAPLPIYQATEGFLAAPCRRGTLHLNEDNLIVERDWSPGSNRFAPIVTDLRRRSQPIVRVRIDDLIEPLDQPCPCGSPCQAIRDVEGRAGDVWRFGDQAIFPREVEACVENALGVHAFWTAIAAPDGVDIQVGQPSDEAPAQAALDGLLGDLGIAVAVAARTSGGGLAGAKRRRVRWSP